ncbi:MAG: peroxiredoxin family protein [Elainellaceae cyanobacterium]
MLTSSNFTGLFSDRFFKNLMPIPAAGAIQIGDRAPLFELRDVTHGETLRLKDYVGPGSAQQPVLLALTRIFTENQYCPLCYPHIVALREASTEIKTRGVAVWMITSTDLDQSVTVTQDLGLPMPLLSDPSCQVFRDYGVGQALGAPLPAQFLIDGAGYVRFRHLFSFLEPNASIERTYRAIEKL